MIIVEPGYRYRLDTHSDVARRLAEIVRHVVGRCPPPPVPIICETTFLGRLL